jgi:hypothetical protein
VFHVEQTVRAKIWHFACCFCSGLASRPVVSTLPLGDWRLTDGSNRSALMRLKAIVRRNVLYGCVLSAALRRASEASNLMAE